MADDEGGGGLSRIGGYAHIEECRTQCLHHIETELHRRTVVLDIPGSEGEFVLARFQLRYAVIGGTAGIGSEIVGEIAVQHVGLRHVAIYHQLQVVADTASGSIDSVLIGYLCHKERSGVDIAAIYEGRRIEIAVDGRTDGIVLLLLALAYRKLLAGAVGREGLGGIHRIEVDQTALVGIIDIHRNGKGEGKLAASYAICALIQGLGSVFVFESRLSTLFIGIIQATGNRLLRISYGSGDDAPEVVCSLDMTCHAGDRACLEHRQRCGSGNRYAVDGIYNYLMHWQIE